MSTISSSSSSSSESASFFEGAEVLTSLLASELLGTLFDLKQYEYFSIKNNNLNYKYLLR
jgi:hypothetical protein